MSEPVEKTSTYEITDDEVRISYGDPERGFKEVGYGHTDVFTQGVPSFRRFFLHPWAHKRLYTHGAQAYVLFPWRVCYCKLNPWTTTLRPLVMAPTDEDLDDPQDLIRWIRARRIELGLLEANDNDGAVDA